MWNSISIRTGARLHFGLLAVQASAGRNFGGVGLMVDSPECHLTVVRSEQDEIHADAELATRLAAWREAYRLRCPLSFRPDTCRIEIHSTIPMHAGLGSGTQTALALAAALANFAGESDIPATELARRVGRGVRSALGIHGFQHGGLLVEAGKQQSDEISPLITRLAFPSEWRFLLLTPPSDSGLSGDAERSAFMQLGQMATETTDRLCRIVLMDLLPAVTAHDFEATSTALFEFGRLNGNYFTPVQGGLFANSDMQETADWLIAQGCYGVGQSSWGPTLFALCRTQAEAESLQHAVANRSISNQHTVSRIVAARTTGARFEASPDHSQSEQMLHAEGNSTLGSQGAQSGARRTDTE